MNVPSLSSLSLRGLIVQRLRNHIAKVANSQQEEETCPEKMPSSGQIPGGPRQTLSWKDTGGLPASEDLGCLPKWNCPTSRYSAVG